MLYWTLFLYYQQDQNVHPNAGKVYRVLFGIGMLGFALLVIVNIFTGVFFVIDAQALTVQFADYLRDNYTDMTSETMIPTATGRVPARSICARSCGTRMKAFINDLRHTLEQVGAQKVLIRTADGYAVDLSAIRVTQEP